MIAEAKTHFLTVAVVAVGIVVVMVSPIGDGLITACLCAFAFWRGRASR